MPGVTGEGGVRAVVVFAQKKNQGQTGDLLSESVKG